MIISIIHYAILFNLAAASDGTNLYHHTHHQLDRHLAACSDFNGDKWGCQAPCTYDNPSKLCTGDLNPAPTTAQPTTANPTTANPTTANPTTAQPTTKQVCFFFALSFIRCMSMYGRFKISPTYSLLLSNNSLRTPQRRLTRPQMPPRQLSQLRVSQRPCHPLHQVWVIAHTTRQSNARLMAIAVHRVVYFAIVSLVTTIINLTVILQHAVISTVTNGVVKLRARMTIRLNFVRVT